MPSLQNLVFLVTVQHISIWTSHISRVQWPHVASGHCNRQCSSRGSPAVGPLHWLLDLALDILSFSITSAGTFPRQVRRLNSCVTLHWIVVFVYLPACPPKALCPVQSGSPRAQHRIGHRVGTQWFYLQKIRATFSLSMIQGWGGW